MRILADMRTHFSIADPAILQVEKTPPVGEAIPINGKFVVDIPEGSSVKATSASYILNGGVIDAGSIVTEAFAGLLAQYPQFDNIVFNPLLVAADVADLDLAALFPQFPGLDFSSRAQVGRAGVDPQEGLAPNSTAILPSNPTATPSRPGLLITDTIDIAAQTGGEGAREFLVYWKIFDFAVSEDITSDFGVTAGSNDPAIRSIMETDQEPAGFTVYVSSDDGTTYHEAGRMEPIAFCDPGTAIRLAFRNDSSSKVYLASYAVLF